MILTESILRKMIAEEYENLKKESGRPIMYRGSNLRNDPSLYGPGGSSDTDAALQTLFSIFYKKQESDMTPDLVNIAKNLYSKYVKEFGQEQVDNYIKKNKLDILHKHVGAGASVKEGNGGMINEWETSEVIKRSRDGMYYVYEVDDEGNSTRMGEASRDDFERLGYRVPEDFEEGSGGYNPANYRKRRWR